MIPFLFSPLGRYLMAGLAVLALLVGVEFHGRHVQSKHDAPIIAGLKSDVRTQKAATAAALASLKISEDKRAVEYSQAVNAAGEADMACAARVKAAHRAAVAIRSIVERPVVVDPKGCPSRVVVSADELRSALQP